MKEILYDTVPLTLARPYLKPRRLPLTKKLSIKMIFSAFSLAHVLFIKTAKGKKANDFCFLKSHYQGDRHT